ncbi:MAG: hypothetical protein KGI50_06450 [Patescibacteria group bacterium]|nr:hypothetical protein [Patescibacteria group bacterium]MDE2439185.1 hypothetical protein [Patescibacteria group bacterium]
MTKYVTSLKTKINTFYDAAEEEAAKRAAEEAAKKKAEEEAAARTRTRQYTEEEFQKAIAAEKARADETAKKAIAELEQHKKSLTLTSEEKQKLQARIDELNTQFLTKEELLRQEKDKLVTTHEAEKKALTEERDTWRRNFVDSKIAGEIMDAAAKADAHNPSVFLALLKDKTEVVEEKDEAGRSKGFKVVVKLEETDKEGKPIVLSLDPVKAIKQLKDKPETHGYLFKGHTNTGVGGQGSENIRQADLENMNMEDYKKNRQRIMK